MLVCQICGYTHDTIITAAHLKTHNMGTKEYHARFPGHKLRQQSAETKAKIGVKANGRPNPKNRRPASEETKAKISAKAKQRYIDNPEILQATLAKAHSPEARAKMSASRKGKPAHNKGVPLTEEHKRKLSAAKKGVPNLKLRGYVQPEEVKQRISNTLKGRKLTPEQAERHRKAMREMPLKEGYVPPMQNKSHSEESKEKIKLASIENAGYVREKMEANGLWVPLEQVSEFEIYKRKVQGITESVVHLIPGYDADKRGLNGGDNHQVDHIYSITQGFKNNVPPEVIGHVANLRFIHWKDNNEKASECDITLEELYARTGQL